MLLIEMGGRWQEDFKRNIYNQLTQPFNAKVRGYIHDELKCCIQRRALLNLKNGF